MKHFTIVDFILRRRGQFFAEIKDGIALPEKMRAMLFLSSAFLVAYGTLLGSTHSLWQTMSSATKLPLLFLVTLLICAPALYVVNVLFGFNQSLDQSLALVLTAISITAILLLSFAPITLFFVLTVRHHYQIFKLLNVFFFVIAGTLGAATLSQGMALISTATQADSASARPQLLFYLWLTVYAFVGSQVAWTLRPFFGHPNAPFELVRQLGGNFYTDILASFGEILGFVIVKGG